jgi:DNA-binding PadR family transcriptional regulator
MTDSSAGLASPDYLVLGMVRLGARSGYEIKRMVELSLRFFWTISPAQIYPSLERLERSGLVVGRPEALGRRRRRAFAITSAGEATLQAWLRKPEPIPFELRDLGLLKLFFADALDKRDALALLRAIERRSRERVAALQAIEPAALATEAQGAAYPLLTLQLGIAFHRAMLEVCREFEPKLSAESAGLRTDATG